MPSKKLFVLTSLLVVVGILVVACQPETVVETVVVTEVVEGEQVEVVVTATPSAEEPEEVAAEGPIPAEGLIPCMPLPSIAGGRSGPGVAAPVRARSDDSVQGAGSAAEVPGGSAFGIPAPLSPEEQEGLVYRVGVFEDLTSTNYWGANGPDNTVWNAYMLPQRLTMYNLSDQRFDFVPLVAKELPGPLAQEGDFWVVEIPIRDDITWSDGEPFTAEDVAFTIGSRRRTTTPSSTTITPSPGWPGTRTACCRPRSWRSTSGLRWSMRPQRLLTPCPKVPARRSFSRRRLRRTTTCTPLTRVGSRWPGPTCSPDGSRGPSLR
jgi:hypothetical protein